MDEEFARDAKRAKTTAQADALETDNDALRARVAALAKENDVLATDNRNIGIQNRLLTAELLAANVKLADAAEQAKKVAGLEMDLREALRSAEEYKAASYSSFLKVNELKAKLEAKK